MSPPLIESARPGMGDEELSALLFRTGGIRIIAVGPPGCLRILYFRALAAGAMHRLLLCPVTKTEYSLGSYLPKVRQCIEAVMNPGLKGIVLYISCPDLLSQTDFEGLLPQLHNPGQVPIAIFKRGPMEKRKKKAVDRMKEILASFGITGPAESENEEDAGGPWPLPPMAADYSGVLSLFRDEKLCAFLLTGSGCASCPQSVDSFQSPFWHSNLDDLQVTLGQAAAIGGEMQELLRSTGNGRLLVAGTPITAMTGLDETMFPALVERACFVAADGFHNALEGVSRGLLQMASKRMSYREKNRKCLNIIGYTPFVYGDWAQFEEIALLFKKLGYQIHWLGGESDEAFASAPEAVLNWVISEAGIDLAKWMQQRFGTPWFYQMPLGISGFNRSLAKLAEMTGDGGFGQYDLAENHLQLQGTVLLLGKHALLGEMEQVLHEDFGLKTMRQEDVRSISWPKTGCVYRMADPLYFPYFGENDGRRIPLPFPALSGNLFLTPAYAVVGSKGNAYLKGFLTNK